MFSNIDPGSETIDIVTTAPTTLNGVSNRNGVVTTDMTGGGTTDGTTATIATDGTETGTEVTSVSVTDVTSTDPTGNSQCICLLVCSIILTVSLYMSK